MDQPHSELYFSNIVRTLISKDLKGHSSSFTHEDGLLLMRSTSKPMPTIVKSPLWLKMALLLSENSSDDAIMGRGVGGGVTNCGLGD